VTENYEEGRGNHSIFLENSREDFFVLFLVKQDVSNITKEEKQLILFGHP
jgi:hypothetical protein